MDVHSHRVTSTSKGFRVQSPCEKVWLVILLHMSLFSFWKGGKSSNILVHEWSVHLTGHPDITANMHLALLCSGFFFFFSCLGFLQEFHQPQVRSWLLKTPKLQPLCSGIPPNRAKTSWAITWTAVWLAPRSGPRAITGPTSTPGNFFALLTHLASLIN